jgi:hypothetical protein
VRVACPRESDQQYNATFQRRRPLPRSLAGVPGTLNCARNALTVSTMAGTSGARSPRR